MTIKSWPQEDRPREKLLKLGAKALTNTELLAIFLRVGIRGKSAIDLARDMLVKFHGLRGLLTAEYQEFITYPGLGLAKYSQLQATLEISRRFLAESMQRQNILSNPEITRHYLQSQLRDKPQEIFAVIFLDNQNQVIIFEELFIGTINTAAVYPREIIKRILHHNAASVIFTHNHPSGIAEPSEMDIELTQTLAKALALIEVRVLDHIIIGEGKTVSFAERGLL